MVKNCGARAVVMYNNYRLCNKKKNKISLSSLIDVAAWRINGERVKYFFVWMEFWNFRSVLILASSKCKINI